jgi:hypothetical protein
MTHFGMSRLWLALLLLTASLSSSPMGSMEQGGGAAAIGHALEHHALPIARPVDVASIGESDLSPGDDVRAPQGAVLPPGAALIAPRLLHRTQSAPPPRQGFPGPRISERLPYQPNAPPRPA